MRSRSSVLVVAAVLSTAVGACAPSAGVAPSTTSAATTTTLQSTAGTTPAGPAQVVVGVGGLGAPRSLNPFLDTDDAAVLDLITPAVFATGYDIDPDTRTPVPDVLEQIPSVANGGIVPTGNGTMEVTVRVDPAATWADGTRITADDLAFTIELATDPDLPIRADVRERYSKIVPGSVRASGRELTFLMELDPVVELLFGVIVPSRGVSRATFATDWTEDLWLGGGPFVLESYEPGRFLALQRNQAYWKVDPATGAPLPRFDRLVFRFFEPGIGEDPRLFRAFERKDLDVALLSFPDGAAEPYLALEPDGVVVAAVPGMAWEQINFQFGPGNRNPESLNRYTRFRRAVAAAIDRTVLAERRGTYPLESVLRSYLPELGGDPWAAYPYNPRETAGLLYDLGEEIGEDLFAGDGPRLVITTSSDATSTVTLAGDIVVMLNDAGIAAELQLEDSALFFGQTLDNGTWDVGAWKFEGNPGRSGAVNLVEMFDPEGLPFVGSNFFRWGTVDSTVQTVVTQRYAGLVDDLRATIDPDEIDALLVQAEQLLASQMVLIPLIVHERSGAAYWSDRVEGIVPNPAQSDLWQVEWWAPPRG